MKHSFAESTEFRLALLSWYEKHARRLPWRESTDPYEILVSELMLQQTQVTTVLEYYRRWLERFPTIGDLAEADESFVLCEWQGLGYYQRARNLHLCAKIIATRLSGRFPSTVPELIQLPGVGKYTAGAIVNFAFDRPAPIVDTNIGRVLSRLANMRCPIDNSKGQKLIWDLAQRFATENSPRRSNGALMELGATVCTPRKPSCGICPVKAFCNAKDPASLPRKKKRSAIEERNEDYFFAVREGHVLLERCTGRRWQGLWALPILIKKCVETTEQPIVCIRHPITRFRIRLSVFDRNPPAQLEAKQQWISLEAIEDLPMPTPHRRALKLALTRRSHTPKHL
ncbi:MAG: A/G-specific adenine glycosylase [Acidobacteria bacterium]|nr:MAG: A/G-specific adenine glycosylase [Acidobacteriota bacterium]